MILQFARLTAIRTLAWAVLSLAAAAFICGISVGRALAKDSPFPSVDSILIEPISSPKELCPGSQSWCHSHSTISKDHHMGHFRLPPSRHTARPPHPYCYWRSDIRPADKR